MTLPLNDPLKLPAPGEIIELPRAAIYLGTDDLRMRLSKVADGEPVHPSQEWVHIEGQALNEDGSNRGYRSALVDVRALLLLMEGDDA